MPEPAGSAAGAGRPEETVTRLGLITTQPDPHTAVTVCGEVDLHSAPTLLVALREIFQQRPLQHLVVDLSNVPFLDSTGLGVLLGGCHQAGPQPARADIALELGTRLRRPPSQAAVSTTPRNNRFSVIARPLG